MKTYKHKKLGRVAEHAKDDDVRVKEIIKGLYDIVHEGQTVNNKRLTCDELIAMGFEEITKPSYIVTEEGEIIGEYEGECWYVGSPLLLYRRAYCTKGTNHFITKKQAEAYVKREKARRELRQLYYESGYEENKGTIEVYLSEGYKVFDTENFIKNPSLPHCTIEFQEKMLELPRVQELYKIIFGIDE